MVLLSAISAQAISRLRGYVPPPTSYSSVPLSRRAAVLILLFADRRGDLKVVLTLRASTLKSYPGQVALPGGKADTLSETPFQTARREAFEEIGLPDTDMGLPKQFRVEHLCELPATLARSELVVRPCVAFLHAEDRGVSVANAEETLIPRLDAKEVAAVFTAPLQKFLDQSSGDDSNNHNSPWYEGNWTKWHGKKWRIHNFNVPIRTQAGSRARSDETQQTNVADLHPSSGGSAVTRYRVWGMTARLLVDAARLAYDREPAFDHDSTFGAEDVIGKLLASGRLGDGRSQDDELAREELSKAPKL
ncbi:hypothetical protein L228DRAFT_279169 [Xylona heveae TC161]|uniref:Nudix hydrolase domain-containing protein n=1 Tax=Xylona heveae (strain CBS 132557 / TC161) TaxID=1328760 RepID=A0A165J8R4_XYLHT|nr:hypothetical protein L228DRAFT_279169 [Xylona heveae TC161]KZF25903.1 hypothetical protein L228DRAFT_279169 [Xylona heveae TC161]